MPTQLPQPVAQPGTPPKDSPLPDTAAVDAESALADSAIFTLDVTGANLSTANIPAWSGQGPGPMVGAVAPHPFDPNVPLHRHGQWRRVDEQRQDRFFRVRKRCINEESKTILNEYANFLIRNPDLRVEIGGHTDSVGDSEYNLKLSNDRVLTVYKYLLNENGDKDRGKVPASQLKYKGFGEDSPIATNDTNAGRALNRRVELVVDHWQSLTSGFTGLSIGNIAVSPLDAGGNAVTRSTRTDHLVLYASTATTGGAGQGDAPQGLLKSVDGGQDWSPVGDLAGLRITKVVPTTLKIDSQQVVLVSALSGRDSQGVVHEGGIFRSIDGGGASPAWRTGMRRI